MQASLHQIKLISPLKDKAGGSMLDMKSLVRTDMDERRLEQTSLN